MVALDQVAAVIGEEQDLLVGLGTLRDNLHAKVVGHGNDGRGDDRILRILLDVTDKRAIDLQLMKRQTRQVTQ